jgi:hypothetical protein
MKQGEFPQGEIPQAVQEAMDHDRQVETLKRKRSYFKRQKNRLSIKDIDQQLLNLLKAKPSLRTGTEEAQNLYNQLKDKTNSFKMYKEFRRYLSTLKEEDLNNPVVKKAIDKYRVEFKTAHKMSNSKIKNDRAYKRLRDIAKTNPIAKSALAHFHLNTFEGARMLFNDTRLNAMTNAVRDMIKVKYAIDHGTYNSPPINAQDLEKYGQHMTRSYPEVGPSDYDLYVESEKDESPINEADKEQKTEALQNAQTLADKENLDALKDIENKRKNIPHYREMIKKLSECIRNKNG